MLIVTRLRIYSKKTKGLKHLATLLFKARNLLINYHNKMLKPLNFGLII